MADWPGMATPGGTSGVEVGAVGDVGSSTGVPLWCGWTGKVRPHRFDRSGKGDEAGTPAAPGGGSPGAASLSRDGFQTARSYVAWAFSQASTSCQR